MSKTGGQRPYGYYTPGNRRLTDKEVQALDGICADKTQYAISIELDVDPANITRRLNSAKRKLGAATLPGLAVKYERMKQKE